MEGNVLLICLFVLFALVSSGGFFAAAVLNRKYEEMLPITMMLMIAVQFLFGIAGCLEAGFYTVLGMCVLCYPAGLIYAAKKARLKTLCRNFFSIGFVLFALLFALLVYTNYGRLAVWNDEFSHWMDIVKVMTQLNDFGTNPLSNSKFPSYPPGLSLIEYFFEKLWLMICGGNFCEWIVFLPFQLFFYALAFPFLKKLSIKKPLALLAYVFVLFFVPRFYYDVHSSLLVDKMLGMLSAAGMARVLLSKKKDRFDNLYILLVCTTLVLAKDAGLLFAIFLAIAWWLSICAGKPGRKRIVFSAFIAAVAVLLPKLLWKMELAFSKSKIMFGNSYNIADKIQNILAGGYERTVLDNFIDALFHRGPTLYISSIVDVYKVTIPYCILTPLLLAGLIVLSRIFIRKNTVQRSVGNIVCLASAVQIFVYVAGLLITYICKFSEMEAVALASFDRYMGIGYSALTMLVFLSILDILIGLKGKKGNFSMIVFVFIMILISHRNEAIQLISRTEPRSSLKVRAPFEELSAKIADTAEEGDKVWYASQKEQLYGYFITKYNVRPIQVGEAHRRMGKPDDSGLPTCDITAEEWRRKLIDEEYDYVAIYLLDDYFLETYGCLFEDPSRIAENCVYRVDKNTGTLSLCE